MRVGGEPKLMASARPNSDGLDPLYPEEPDRHSGAQAAGLEALFGTVHHGPPAQGGRAGPDDPGGWSGQPYPGFTDDFQADPGAAYAGQPHSGSAHPGSPYGGSPYGGQGRPGAPNPGQPHPGRPYAGQPHPGPQRAGQPEPGPRRGHAEPAPPWDERGNAGSAARPRQPGPRRVTEPRRGRGGGTRGRRRQWGHDRRTYALPVVAPPVSDRRLAMGRLAIMVTVAAWIGYFVWWLLKDLLNHRYSGSVDRVESILYLLIVSLLTASSLAYLLEPARLQLPDPHPSPGQPRRPGAVLRHHHAHADHDCPLVPGGRPGHPQYPAVRGAAGVPGHPRRPADRRPADAADRARDGNCSTPRAPSPVRSRTCCPGPQPSSPAPWKTSRPLSARAAGRATRP